MKSTKLENNDIKLIKVISIAAVILISIATVVCSYFLIVNTTASYSSYLRKLKKGYIADETVYVKSSVDIKDFKATQEKIEQAKNSVPPVFTFSQKQMIGSLSEFESVSEELDYSQAVDSASYEILKTILARGYYDNEMLSVLKKAGATSIFVMGNEGANKTFSIDSLLCEDNIDEFIKNKIDADYGSSFNDSEKREIELLIRSSVDADFIYDSILTDEHRLKAEESTDPVIINLKKGDVLIQKDTVITQSQLDLLALLSKQGRASFMDLAGEFVLCMICYGIAITVFIYFAKSNKFHSTQYIIILSVLALLNILYMYFALLLGSRYCTTDFPDAFMPVTLVPIYITMVTGKKRFGFIATFMVAVTAALMPQATVYTFFYVGIAACVVIVTAKFFIKRIDYITQWIISLGICGGMMCVFIFITNSSMEYFLYNMLGVLIQTTVASLLIIITMPIVEDIFNLPTDYRLHELAFTDSPLLNRLAKAAPGTYNHSRQVAELAYDAAVAIGANGLLARVGGLYHDIGKTEHPEYFIENQGGGANKHDEISPSLSVSILKSHVSVGSEMAKEAHLPAEIISIVGNHHGNDLIYYFYHEAQKDNNAEKGEVQTEDYSYNNSKIPSFKECAIVMLADSVEAAARTVTEPTAAKFAKLIRSITLGKIERGQLTDSGLTFNDLSVIEKSLLSTLSAQHHARIEYPDDNKDKNENKENGQ